MSGKDIVKAIDGMVAAERNRKRNRRHLGASMAGSPCGRAIFYSWRWFYSVQHGGRLHRLWERGHLEEARFIEYLAEVKIEIIDRDPITGDQFRFSGHLGHYGGSCDGKILEGSPAELGLPPGEGLFEAKTYNDKRFKTLTSKGLLSADPTYYNQMQLYMKAFGLLWGLFIAVNKNDEELYIEIVHYKAEVAEAYDDRTGAIIAARFPPNRISEDPSWFKCKMCDFREICHKGVTPQKNCRTCIYSVAVADGRFMCEQFRQIIPLDFEAVGCDAWDAIK